MLFVSLLIFGIFGFVAIKKIKPKHYDDWWGFFSNLFMALSLPVMFLMTLYYASDNGYYILFEHKQTATTDIYDLTKRENRGRYEYYLRFDDKKGVDDVKIVRINKSTYDKLKIKSNDTLVITYKDKARILYDLQVLPKGKL
ncbi:MULTISPECIES: hypothetical protein [Moraxella]|jgi:hypothetical protein|uniref:Uncharacterized protein n=1 Tax=Moraxella lacunata TaxID=477 RepID=A0A1B8PV90_MORLA|nr:MULTISPECIES: hypothetical protein [Moraxella]MBE9579742.1 hypothetical protein [Moraxella sp. K1664]MBE9589076.1 hypothetical protein [Moraxella sp. K1630]MBE9589659.1 hypothetical protein [Moraxella sp. K127]MBE9597351.1 hypothetical protein [Moraxella sp. K2450]MDH9219860.1 hypothetical protein [Moraxella lacunata]